MSVEKVNIDNIVGVTKYCSGHPINPLVCWGGGGEGIVCTGLANLYYFSVYYMQCQNDAFKLI